MEITERSTAKAAGLSKYFTNRPCVNGHTSERYVQSGACMGCIAASQETIRAAYKTSNATPLKLAQRARIARDMIVRPRCDVRSLPGILAIVDAFALARYPALTGTIQTQQPRLTNKTGVTAIASILCDPDDAATVEAMCRASIDALTGAQP